MLDLHTLAIKPCILHRKKQRPRITIHAVNQIKNPNNKQNQRILHILKSSLLAVCHLKKFSSLSTIFSQNFMAWATIFSHLEYSNSLLLLSSIILSPCPLLYSLHKTRVTSLKFTYDQITSYWNDFSGFPLVLGWRMSSLTWTLAASHLRFCLPSSHIGHGFADTHSFCTCSSPTRFSLPQSKSLP